MDKKILVTGATGFIGEHLIRGLEGDLFAFCRDDSIDEIPFVRGDLRNYDDVERAFYESDPSLVIHLAAVAPVDWAYRAPRQAIATNVLGTINVLDACRDFGNIPCLLVSSDKSYGKPLETPVKETTELNPRHPYDASKASADLISISYSCTYGVPIQIVRPGNVYGPGDQHWNRLIPGALKAAIMKQTFQLRSDGSPIRSYIYVDDLCEAISLLVNAMLMEEVMIPDHGIWNIVPKQSAYSVGEILAHIDKVLGTKLVIELDDKAEKEGETNILAVDGSLFASTFGWSGRTDIEYGIELTASWMNTIL